MAFADRFKVIADRKIDRAWAKQFKELSDFDWPPKNSAEWTIILTRAGFSQQRIEQTLATIGAEGFDGVGELPPGYISSHHDDMPIFSVSLIEGLKRWRRENQSAFVPNDFQKRILQALKGCAMNKQELANEVCGGEGSRLYKPGGLNELKGAGLVSHKHRLGYYRPDAPPNSDDAIN